MKKQIEIEIGDFCLVDGEGLEAFLVIGITGNALELMRLNTSTCIEPKSKCHYLRSSQVEVQVRPMWIVTKA